MKKIYLDPRMPKVFNALKGSDKKASTHKYLKEAYEESLVPIKQNPIGISATDAYEIFPFLYGENGFIAKSLGKSISSEEGRKYADKISSSINALAQTIVELGMNMKVKADKNYSLKNKSSLSAFQHPSLEGMSPSDKEAANRSVEVNQYIRLTIQTLLYSSLRPVFETTKDDVFGILKKLKIDEMPASVLHQTKNRMGFVKKVSEFIMGFTKKIDFKNLISSGVYFKK